MGVSTVHGLASFMALAGSVQLASEVQWDSSDASGPPPPDTQEQKKGSIAELSA